jgi:uncharacterized repeat protein (TIGR01451 family)
VTSAVALLIGAIGFTVFGVGAASGRIDAGTGAKSAAAAHPARVASHARASIRTQAPAPTRAAIRQNGLHVSRPGSLITRSLQGTVIPSFEDSDGNLANDGVMDWNDFAPITWNGTAPYQTAGTSSGGWTFYGVSDAVTSNDTTYKAGTKQADECPTTLPAAAASNKSDLARIYIAGTVNPTNHHVFLVFAWVRAPQNTTSSDVHVAFEFNQSTTACSNGDGLVTRTNGDLLIVYNFQSGSPSLSVASWSASGWSAETTVPASTAELAVNTTGGVVDALKPAGAPDPGTDEFGEAGIDLTQASIDLTGGGRACERFGRVFGESRSSGSSTQANMEDLVGPANVDLSNCVTPTLTTTPNPASGNLGATLNDTADLSGANSPTGNVTFKLYGPSDPTCSGTALYTETDALSGTHAATTGGPAVNTAGTYHWTASYPGDGNNNAASSTCASEAVTIAKATPTIATTPNPASAIVGAALNDTAHVSGGSSPTGNVTFSLFGPADATCSGTALYTKTVALSGSDAATTDGPAVSAAGVYHWTATYNGDGNNNTASSACASEAVTVGKGSPTIATTPNPSSATVGAALNDTAHVSGGSSPTGDVTFNLYSPADATCTGAALYTKTVALAGRDAATSDGPASSVAGTYHWTATYNGDANNSSASSTCASEPVDVGKASPAVATTPNPASATVGADLNDTAQVTGGFSPTGDVTFSLYGPADATCSGTALYTKTVALAGGGAATSDGPASTLAGTYHWTATYNGDGNNKTASSTCASEPVAVGKASPPIATTPRPSSASVGAALNDTAHVSDGFSPTGDVTFSLFGPADANCSGTALYTKTVALSGRDAATSDGPTVDTAGTYHWTATYNGDGNNDTASSACASEAVDVGKASPSIATKLSTGEIVVGTFAHDSSTLTGATSDAGGTATYTVYTNNTCTDGARPAGTVAVSGGDVNDSDSVQFNAAGDYYWQVVYNGDNNNSSAKSACNSEDNEHLLVDKPSISITKNPKSQAIDSGGTATFTITVTNTGTTNLTGVAVSDGQAPGCAKSIGTLNKGESSTYTCSLAGVTSSFTNSATATGHPPVGPDVTATDTAPVTVNAVPPPPPPAPPAPPAPKIDLSITKSGSPNPATLGNRITWTETVMNAGPSPATGVKVADAIPAGTTFVSVTTSLGTCTGGALVSCSLGNMGVGQTATITIVTTANVTGTIPNTATVVGNEAETNTANNTASASVVVKGKFVPPVTYCTAVAVSPKSLLVGRTNTLTLKVTQHGKAKAGIKVHIQGSTIRLTTKPSNGKGVVKQTVKPMKAGIVIFKPVAVSSCKNARVGVIGVFTPPVTG